MRYFYMVAAIIISTSTLNPLSDFDKHNVGWYTYSVASTYKVEGEDVVSDPMVVKPEPVVEPKGRWITVIATGYSPNDKIDRNHHHCKDDFTASMTNISRNPYAVAIPMGKDIRGRSVVPIIASYGAKMYIPTGYGYLDNSRPDDRIFVCDDTGGVINSRTRRTGIPHIDLRFKTEYSAKKFGKKKIEVFIYDE